MKEQFQVLVNGKMCPVFKTEEHHGLGTLNKDPDNYFVKIDGEMVPYMDRWVKRPCFSFDIKESNYSKEKWGRTDLSSTVNAKIYLNRFLVYEFVCRDLSYAFARCQVLSTEMTEHSFNFMDIDSEIGRKVFYHQQPAILERFQAGRVTLRAESEFTFTPDWALQEDDFDPDDDDRRVIATDVFDSHIWWFRK